MNLLECIAPNIWAATTSHSFLGLHVGSRMTVIRLSSGSVLLHSPVPMLPALRAAIEAIGPVKHIVCPNLFHHMYAAQAVTAFPGAKLHGPAKLHKKRTDLRFDAVLSETASSDWQGDLVLVTIDGSLLNETVFYHRPTRTLIACDLVENFKTHPHWITRTYLKLNGVLGTISWPRLLRTVYFNRKLARASIDRILGLPFERVVIAHGDVITDNAHEVVTNGLKWLR